MNISPQWLKYSQACVLFDTMDMDQKESVLHTFDLILHENVSSPNVREAFVAAVVYEAQEKSK